MWNFYSIGHRFDWYGKLWMTQQLLFWKSLSKLCRPNASRTHSFRQKDVEAHFKTDAGYKLECLAYILRWIMFHRMGYHFASNHLFVKKNLIWAILWGCFTNQLAWLAQGIGGKVNKLFWLLLNLIKPT